MNSFEQFISLFVDRYLKIAKLLLEVTMQKFVINYTPGASWKTGKPWSDQGLYSHGEYMDGLYSS